jgi:hypothetical protein
MFTLSLITNKKSILPWQPIGLTGPKSGTRPVDVDVSAAAVLSELVELVPVSPLVVVVPLVEELVSPVVVSPGDPPGPPNVDMLPPPGVQARSAASKVVGRTDTPAPAYPHVPMGHNGPDFRR